METLDSIKQFFETFLNYKENKEPIEPIEIVNKKKTMHKGLFKPYRVVNVLAVDEKGVLQEGWVTYQSDALFHEITDENYAMDFFYVFLWPRSCYRHAFSTTSTSTVCFF